MCCHITKGSYDIIKRNKRRKVLPPPVQKNCDSKNFLAISEMYFAQYTRLKDTELERAKAYEKEGRYYHDVAMIEEKEELEKDRETSWKQMYKKDPKALWTEIQFMIF